MAEMKALPANRIKTDIEAAKAAVSGEKKSAESEADFEKKVSGLTDAEFPSFRRRLLADKRGY